MPEYDVFISHASEDKEGLVRELAAALTEAGFTIWYDESELVWGDSLSSSIDHGLAHSRYGIVVLTNSFFEKGWPKRELAGLVSRQTSEDRQMILPLRHDISIEQIRSFSPPLADAYCLDSGHGVEAIVDQFKKRIEKDALTSKPTKKLETVPKTNNVRLAETTSSERLTISTYIDERLQEISARKLATSGAVVINLVPVSSLIGEFEVDIQSVNSMYFEHYNNAFYIRNTRFNNDGIRGESQLLGQLHCEAQLFWNGAIEAVSYELVHSSEGDEEPPKPRKEVERAIDVALIQSTLDFMRVQFKAGVPMPMYIAWALLGVKGARIHGWNHGIDKDELRFRPNLIKRYPKNGAEFVEVVRPALDRLWLSMGIREWSAGFDLGTLTTRMDPTMVL